MRFFFTVLTAIVLFACCPKQYYLIQPDGITMEMERSGLISYIGLGMLYSCDGIMQTEDTAKGARELHYWIYTRPSRN